MYTGENDTLWMEIVQYKKGQNLGFGKIQLCHLFLSRGSSFASSFVGPSMDQFEAMKVEIAWSHDADEAREDGIMELQKKINHHKNCHPIRLHNLTSTTPRNWEEIIRVLRTIQETKSDKSGISFFKRFYLK